MHIPDTRKRSIASRDSIDMICSILEFLDTSPSRLLEDPSSPGSTNGFFKPFLSCVLSPESAVREIATKVAKRLFEDHGEAFKSPEKAQQLGTSQLRKDLWSRR